jgi:hypothetical protein
MKTKLFCLLTSALCLLNFTGCKTAVTPTQLVVVQKNAQVAAHGGIQTLLSEKPQWRPDAELAYSTLNALVKSGHVTPVDLANFMTTLKINELKNQNVRLAIDAARVLYLFVEANMTAINADAISLAAATGIRDGMAEALGIPPN